MARTYQPARLKSGRTNPKHRTRPTGSRGKRPDNKWTFGQFCAWDGEGVTTDGDHKYVLLANSAGLAQWDARGIGTLNCLGAICAGARALDPRTTHVIFGGSYDVNMWLRDLSPRALAKVWSGGWAIIGDYQYKIQYRARRSFVIHELTTGTKVTIWDVWGFFQGSFVGALEKYNMAVPDRLRKMKQQRSSFRAAHEKQIIEYCHEECALLVELMRQVKEHLSTAGLAIKRWDGAGACAAALLTREHTRQSQSVTPNAVRRAAQHAYAGGRIEMLQYGHAPDTPIHHYDINSAYPAALLNIPSLSDGQWVRIKKKKHFPKPGAFTVWRIKWFFTSSICRAYPFFWRAPNGNIYYPPLGEGWYWDPELRAAQRALRARHIEGYLYALECWTWQPRATERPFAFVSQLYDTRAEWKRTGVGAEKMLKLALNSLYGKCAQHVGGKAGEAPRFHQLEWAGWITSMTRSQLFSAACVAGPYALMVATDGIFSLKEIPGLVQSKALGDWDYHCHHGATVVQSGVYWLDDRSEETAGPPNIKKVRVTSQAFSRGFDKGSLKRNKIVDSWKRKELSWPASLTRFVTMGAVVNGSAKESDWRQWRTMPRVLALTPSGTKRTDRIKPDHWQKRKGSHPAYGFIPTSPSIPAALILGEKFSAAYALPWVDAGLLINDPDIVLIRQAESDALEND